MEKLLKIGVYFLILNLLFGNSQTKEVRTFETLKNPRIFEQLLSEDYSKWKKEKNNVSPNLVSEKRGRRVLGSAYSLRSDLTGGMLDSNGNINVFKDGNLTATAGVSRQKGESEAVYYSNNQDITKGKTIYNNNPEVKVVGVDVKTKEIEGSVKSLDIISVQDSVNGKSRGYSVNVGIGFGKHTNGEKVVNGPYISSVGAGYSKSDTTQKITRNVAEFSAESGILEVKDKVRQVGSLIDGGFTLNAKKYEHEDLEDINKSKSIGINVTVYPNVTYTARDGKGKGIYTDGHTINGSGAVYKVGVNYAEVDKNREVVSTIGSNVKISQDMGDINRDVNNQIKEFEGKEVRGINVDLGTEYWLTEAGRGKTRDIIEGAGRTVEGIKRILTLRDEKGNLQLVKNVEAESLVQKMIRLGFIETRGKTQQQVKKELEEKFGSLTKNGVRVNFYSGGDIDTTKMDVDTLEKLSTNGFAITKDGTVWINKEYVNSGKLIDFNKATQHEISHIVFGEDSEYQAQYLTAAYGEFLREVKENGYLKDGEGIIDYKFSMLSDEDRLRLNGYFRKDMQFFGEMADGIRAAKERLKKCGSDNKCVTDNKRIIHNLEVSLKKFGVQERIEIQKNRQRNISGRKDKGIIARIKGEIEKIKINKNISNLKEEYRELDIEFDDEIKYVISDLTRQIKNEKNLIKRGKAKETLIEKIFAKNDITLSSKWYDDNTKVGVRDGKLVLYAGGNDYNRLKRLISEEGLTSKVEVEYREKGTRDVYNMVAINSFREGKIPPDWMPEHAQALEKKDGKKREWYNPVELVRNGKMTEKEFKRYQNQVGTLRAGYIAQMFAKTGYTVYMAAKTGNYEETSSEEVPKINTKTEIMGQRTVFINDGTPQGTAKAIQTVSGNAEITELKTYIPQTGETIIRTRINATGDIFENVLYNNTGSSISGAAQKPLVQIENSVYNTFGDISKPVVTGKVSSNNLLTEYSATPKYVPAVIPDIIRTVANSPKTTFTATGNISANKILKYGIEYTPVTIAERGIANDIIKNGDITGAKTEKLTSLIAQRLNANELAGGKYYNNDKHGFDIALNNQQGTLLIESKQMTNSGSTKLSQGAGKNMQLTDKWIDAVNNNIYRYNNRNHTPASLEIGKALTNQNLQKAVSVFDKKTGRLVIVPIE